MTSDHIITYNNLLSRVTSLALYSRICLIFLQCICNLLFPDHESDGFISPVTDTSSSIIDDIVQFFFGGLLRWDAQYFLHITVRGYTYENMLAFFPGFPLIVLTCMNLLKISSGFLNVVSLFLISSVIINICCFVLTTRILFHLTYNELKDMKIAYLSCLFFCMNPASIFFLAPYSETLFCLLTFSALGCKDLSRSCILFAFSAFTRSNGIINVGFLMYRLLENLVTRDLNIKNLLVFLFKMITIIFISSCTFFLYQFYSHARYCTHDYSPTERDICSSYIPYFYIQERYWNVGFLHYFQLKQIPNFLLAFPILSFCTFSCVRYFYNNWILLFTLGLQNNYSISDVKIFVYVVHLNFLLFVCFFFIHVQVSTRLLCSSSPVIYWFMAKTVNMKKIQGQKLFDWTYVFNASPTLFLYCISYYIIGTAMFSNFLPWT